MCDIDNPMYGKNGAAFVFAPQKGAEENMVKMLDNNLRILSEKIKKNLNKDVSKIKGSGAAGAFGAGVCAFFNGELKSGIEIILDLIDFDNLIKNADMIFTGEGQIDSQSLNGKVVIGISKRAKKQNIPVIVITGSIGEGAEKAYDKGVSCIADRDDIVLYPYPHCPNGPVLGYKVRKVFHIPVFPGHSRDRNLSGKGIGRYR